MTAAAQHLSTLPRGCQALGAAMQRPAQPGGAGAIVKAVLGLARPPPVPRTESGWPRPRLPAGTSSTPSRRSRSAWRSVRSLWGDRLDVALAGWDGVVEQAVARSEPLRLAFGLTFRGGVRLRAGRSPMPRPTCVLRFEVPQDMWTASACRSTRWRCSPRRCWSAADRTRPEMHWKTSGRAGDLSDYQGNNAVLMARGRIRLARGLADRLPPICSRLGAPLRSGRCAIQPRSRGAPRRRSPSGPRIRRGHWSWPRRSRARSCVRRRRCARCRPAGRRTRPRRRRGRRAARGGRRGVRHLPARLEHARALVDLGAAQRRAGLREAARQRLAEGLDGAVVCGAVALAEYARAELALAGARPVATG